MRRTADVVTLEHGQFLVDGRPFLVYSGEIHYFRLEPSRWETHLRAARAAGLNAVSSYIPWIWHEPEEARFDFSGKTHPQRDLVRFLSLVGKHGLKFLARIGPVSNAELVNEGIPQWLIDGHPEILVRGRELTNLPHTMLLAYLNPTFQEYTRRWYDQVLPLIADRAHPRGPTIIVQLCNEIGMVHWLQKAADYSAGTEERYRAFLRGRYHGDVAALNRACGTGVDEFTGIAQPPSGDDRQNRRLLWDWMSFYEDYYAAYFESLFARYRRHGLSLPVLANIPQFYDFDVRGRGVFSPMTSMMFREFPARVPQVVFGGAYQMRRLDYENFHDIAITTEVLKMIATPGIPSVCAELQTGIMRDRPRLYPQDVELNLKTSVAHGLNGVNAYMFSGGRNDLSLGALGSYHEWQAAVTPEGGRRPHFEPIRDFGRQLRTFGALLSDTCKHCDAAVGFYAPYYTTEYLSGPAIERLEWKKLHLFYDGIGRLLQLANINFSFLDLEKATPEELGRHPALIVFAVEFMDEAVQARLRDYVRDGGRLLLNPDLPVEDLGQERCTVLADYLGVKTTGRRERGLGYLVGARDYLAQGEITTFEPGGAKVIARTLDDQPCGLRIERHGGLVLLLGFGLNHMFDYQIALLRDFAGELGVHPAVTTDGDLQLCLRANERYGFLFVANFHDVPNAGKIRMTLPGETKPAVFPARGRIALGNRRCYMLPLNVPLADGELIRYATAEVLEASANRGRKTFVVTGTPGTEAEMELVTAASSATLDGKRLVARRLGRRIRLGFPLSGGRQTLVVK
jgi:beta-galactosidase